MWQLCLSLFHSYVKLRTATNLMRKHNFSVDFIPIYYSNGCSQKKSVESRQMAEIWGGCTAANQLSIFLMEDICSIKKHLRGILLYFMEHLSPKLFITLVDLKEQINNNFKIHSRKILMNDKYIIKQGL